MTEEKKLYRSTTDRLVFGICGGLGQYFKIDPVIFRLLFVLLAFANGIGIVVYLIMALIVPKEGAGEAAENGKNDFAGNLSSKAHELADEVKAGAKNRGKLRNNLGLVIILIGLILLVREIFPISFDWINWSFVWPVAIIFIGSYLIFKKITNAKKIWQTISRTITSPRARKRKRPSRIGPRRGKSTTTITATATA